MPMEKRKKCAALAALQISFPPEKQLAGAARRQRKKPPEWAANSVILPFWCNFTLLREPNFSEAVSKPSPNACGRTRPLAPPDTPFAYFLVISPRRILIF
jgi:hypothetical protein